MELQPPDHKPYGRSVGANDSQRSTCPVIPHQRPCSHRSTKNISAGGRVNSQLTSTYSSYDGLDIDGETPLTPNHLLRVNASVGLPLTRIDEEDSYVRRGWRHVQYLVDRFSKKFD